MIRLSHADQNGKRDRPSAWRWPIALGAVTATAMVGTIVAVGTVARRVVTPSKRRYRDSEVLAFSAERKTITLRVNPDTVLPGRYGLFYGHPDHYLQMGDVLWKDRGTITRKLITEELAGLPPSGDAAFSGWFFDHPFALGVEYQDVEVPTEFGPAPAWFVPGENTADRWVIAVHGRGTTRSECLRAVPVIAKAGYNSLLVSYRNDGVAPRSGDGLYGLGGTEWRDVDAAIEFAVARGVREIVLMGWSMGGAIVIQTAFKSVHAGRIRGIMLDSPVLDWGRVLEYQADAGKIPRPLRTAAIAAVSQSWGRVLTGQHEVVDFSSLDVVARAQELILPMLLMHSDDDGFVPSSASHDLAEARPDIVTFVPFTVARHTKLWNYDEERWTTAISEWLAALPKD